MEILQWVLIVLSVPLIVLMIVQTRRRAKALNERIEEYWDEQEEAKSKPGPVNPYEDLASLVQASRKPGKDSRS